MFSLLVGILLIPVLVATARAEGSKARWFKVFFLVLLGVLLPGAGVCVLILSNMKGDFH